MRKPAAERFWAKVDQSGGPDACWPWTGYRNRAGYGWFALEPGTRGHHKPTGAHRVSVILTRGPFDDRLVIRHSCDNPPCCNPAHLLVGTPAENTKDTIARGRRPVPATKLTVDAVRAIRSASELTGRELAAEHGVSITLIYKIRRRTIWKSVA